MKGLKKIWFFFQSTNWICYFKDSLCPSKIFKHNLSSKRQLAVQVPVFKCIERELFIQMQEMPSKLPKKLQYSNERTENESIIAFSVQKKSIPLCIWILTFHSFDWIYRWKPVMKKKTQVIYWWIKMPSFSFVYLAILGLS